MFDLHPKKLTVQYCNIGEYWRICNKLSLPVTPKADIEIVIEVEMDPNEGWFKVDSTPQEHAIKIF